MEFNIGDTPLSSKEFTGEVTMSEVVFRMKQLRGELHVERPEPEEEGIINISKEELNLEDTLDALLDGEVIVLTTRDGRKDKDRLIRFKKTRHGYLSQISTPTSKMEGFVGDAKYWTLYDISINVLSLYPTYIYEPDKYDLGNKYTVGTMVEYLNPREEADIGVVLEVHMDQESDRFYYTLSGEYDRIFFEEEIANVISVGSN